MPNIRKNVDNNVRHFLKEERLVTEELLTKLVWKGRRGMPSSKLPIYRKRITYDLQTVLKDMYPDMRIMDFKQAVQKALKAAMARIASRRKSAINENDFSQNKRQRIDDEEYFNRPWTLDNTEQEDEEVIGEPIDLELNNDNVNNS